MRERFGSANDTRLDLMDKLQTFLELAASTRVFREAYIDGSFVTSKSAPNDVDLCLLPVVDLTVLLTAPNGMRFVDPDAFKRDLKMHVFVGPAALHLLDFFQGIRLEDALLRGLAADERKGIVKVNL